MTPEQARRQAAKKREQAARLIGEAAALDAYASEVERVRLQADSVSDSLKKVSPDQKLKISASRGGGQIAAAARAKGMSLRDLARAVGLSQPYLSQMDSGVRRMTPAVAERLRTAIGWPE